jgi:predicted kinase
MVRAKVALLKAEQLPQGEEWDAARSEARSYVALALRYTQKGKVFAAMTHGYSGSGKSTVAMALVERCGALRIRSDAERLRLYGAETTQRRYAPEAGRVVYERLARIAKTVTESGYPVVVDATFLKRWQRETMEAAGIEALHILDLQCSDEVLRERIRRRAAEGNDISEADLDVLSMQRRNEEPLSDLERAIATVIDCGSVAAMERSMAQMLVRVPLPCTNQS